jgi:hypothetical protein
MMLYQYRGDFDGGKGLEYLSDLLNRGSLKFSMPSEFNDPFDCCPTQLEECPVGDLPHAVVDGMNQSLQRASGQLHGIACFTPHPDRMLMWSHYADHHQGLCVGFDSASLLRDSPQNSEGNPLYRNITAVTYTQNRPGPEGTEQFFYKAEAWGYEAEHRLISLRQRGHPEWGPGVWPIPKAAVIEVVLGARMPEHIAKQVVSLVKANAPSVALRKAVLHMHTFEILIEDLAAQPEVAPMRGYVRGPNGDWLDT